MERKARKMSARERKAYDDGYDAGYGAGYTKGLHDGNPLNKVQEALSNFSKSLAGIAMKEDDENGER